MVLGACIVASGLGYLGVAALADWRWAVAGLVVFAHAASGANWVLSTTLLQERSEDAFRGRVIATDWLTVTLVQSASILVASRLLEAGVGLTAVIVGLAGAQLATGLGWMMTVVPAETRDEAVPTAA